MQDAEKLEERAKYYKNVADQQMAAVDSNFMREQDPRMPLLQPERKTRVDFGKG